MKNLKKKACFLAVFLMTFCMLLSGCNAITLVGGPLKDDYVYGNGGSAVVKGDYLYFANAFIDYKTVHINDNKYDKRSPQTIYGIYRTKLENSGNVTLDEDGFPKGAEILTYNIGGFAYSGLYIFGDFLYYVTPYSKETSGSTEKNGLMRFERVRLDGHEHEILKAEDNYSDTCKYEMISISESVYIIYTDKDQKLNVIRCKPGSKDFYTLGYSVSSFGVYRQKNIRRVGVLSDDAYKFIYYTEKLTENDINSSTTSYNLKKVAFDKGSIPTLCISNSQDEIKIKKVINGAVYYEEDSLLKSFSPRGQEHTYTDITLKGSSDSGTDKDQITDYAILESESDIDLGMFAVLLCNKNYSFVVYDKNGIHPISGEDISSDKTKKITIVGINGRDIFYQVADDKALYLLKLNDDYLYVKTKIATNFSPTVSDANMFDCDNLRVFTYETVHEGSLNYLTLYLINPSSQGEGDISGQYIGVLKKEDMI